MAADQNSSTAALDLEKRITKTADGAPNLATTQTIQSRIERPENPLREVAFVFILCMCQFMTQAGSGMAFAPLHIIGDSFGTQNAGELSWFPAAYSLTVGTFILPSGRLGDLYGHKKFVLIGYTWFALWSILAGFSVYSTAVFFDVCRAFQGIGAALMVPNSIAILGRAYPPGPRKSMVFSIYGSTAPVGYAVGCVFSSLLAKTLWWPWAFWGMGIVLLLCAAFGIFFIPYTPPPVLDDSVSMVSRVDALGGITGVAGLVLINFAWNEAPSAGWTTPYTYITLIIGFAFMGIFGFVETKVAVFPLIPIKGMKADTGFILAAVGLGAQFLPAIVSGACAAITTGLIMDRVPGSLVMMIALLAFTVGLVILATAPVKQTYWGQTFVSLIIMPWGMDMSFPAANILLSNQMSKEHQGVSASLVNTVINYSISLALGIAGTLEGHINNGGQDLLKGYRGAWYLGIGFAAAGIIISGIFGISSWNIGKEKPFISEDSSILEPGMLMGNSGRPSAEEILRSTPVDQMLPTKETQ